MANEHIATYLNDHLAGSTGALELLDRLEAEHAGTRLAPVFAGLSAEVAEDRRTLEAFMERFGVPRSRTRMAAAWFSEKVTQLKLRVDDPGGGEFRLLQSLEALALGIEGKKSLWETLREIASGETALPDLDYGQLIRRAEQQRARVEEERIAAARRALTGKA